MRLRSAAFAGLLASLLAAGSGGCAVATPSAGSATGAPTATADPASSVAPQGAAFDPGTGPPPPARSECDTFMDVVARTTLLRASIHRDAPSAVKAAGWAAQCTALSTEAKALPLTHPDLLIENARLATRMSDLAKELEALAKAEKGSDAAKKAAAHKRVLDSSEQVEVITREPAARCAGDTKKLITTSGRLPPEAIQRAIRDRFPLATKCYEAGLARDPKLEGRVLVRLVIGLDGKVTEASPVTGDAAKGADVLTPGDAPVPPMPDAKVTACVVDVLRQTVFPPPDGGTVSVVYPVTFSRNQ